MPTIKCEICGSSELIKQGDVFICKKCGCSYTPEDAKKLYSASNGTGRNQQTSLAENNSPKRRPNVFLRIILPIIIIVSAFSATAAIVIFNNIADNFNSTVTENSEDSAVVATDDKSSAEKSEEKFDDTDSPAFPDKENLATEEPSESILFGTNAEFPPFEFITDDGIVENFDGIDIAIADAIAKDNEMTVNFSDMAFDELLPALESGKIDAAIAALTSTPERKEFCDFSIPYYSKNQVMVTLKGTDIKTAADMENMEIGVIEDSLEKFTVSELGYAYIPFKNYYDAFPALFGGSVDVIVADNTTAAEYAAQYPNLVIVEDEDSLYSEEYSIAVKKGNTELLDKINASIEKFLADGTISDILHKYIK